MTILEQLRSLYEQVEVLTGDRSTIVRLDVDANVPEGGINLVIITKGKYLPILLDANDCAVWDTTAAYALDWVRKYV